MTTITWREAVNGGSQIIKLDDQRSSWPAEGDEVTLNGRRYKVIGLERAEVLLEALEPPPADPANPAMKDGKPVVAPHVDDGDSPLAKRNERVAQRLADEDTEKVPVKAGPASKHPDYKPAPKHLTQHRHRDPLRSTKAVSHKKK